MVRRPFEELGIIWIEVVELHSSYIDVFCIKDEKKTNKKNLFKIAGHRAKF
jgi:hypothetical protein